MKRTISSESTFVLKVLVPACLLAGWILSLLNFVLSFWGDPFYRFVFPLLIALVIAFCWQIIQIKRVSVDEDYLYVSNYLREVRLPLETIDEVVPKDLVNVRLLTVYLKAESAVGRAITFLPKAFNASDVADCLRRSAQAH